MISNKELVNYLKELTVDTGFINKLKIVYRPYVCPFGPLLGFIEDDDVVLDIGCGSGQFGLLAAKFANPKAIYGIEIDENLIYNANQIFNSQNFDIHFSFEVFNGKDFPKNLALSDIIFLIDVLHHVPLNIRVDFFKNIVSAMKPGARIVLKDINAGSPLVLANKVHDLVFAKEIGNEISFNDAIKLLKDLDLKIEDAVKTTTYVYPHYTIVAKKES